VVNIFQLQVLVGHWRPFKSRANQKRKHGWIFVYPNLPKWWFSYSGGSPIPKVSIQKGSNFG
jgi:hypothetical protein